MIKNKPACCLQKTTLYAWGANNHGQLGLGIVSDQVVEPIEVDVLPDNLSESSIVLICGGGAHSMLLTKEGFLYGSGRNDFGQVGNGTQSKVVLCFERVRGLEGQRVTSVSCGWNHTVALTDERLVWVWGSNAHSQLGLPVDEVPFSCLPICVNLPECQSVSAGLRHTAVATCKGDVYTWGQGLRGQLGIVDDEGKMIQRQPFPRKLVSIEKTVVQVCCGQKNTYALTNLGQICAWGDNKWGQLAYDPANVAFFSYPLLLPCNFFGGSHVKEIGAGWTHCVALTESKTVYLWGRADYGQVAPFSDQEEEVGGREWIKPTSVNSLPPDPESLSSSRRYRYIPKCFQEFSRSRVSSIHCGSEHTLAVIETPGVAGNELVSFGWNEHGNCGNGLTENVLEPFTVPVSGLIQLAGCGAAHSFALTSHRNCGNTKSGLDAAQDA